MSRGEPMRTKSKRPFASWRANITTMSTPVTKRLNSGSRKLTKPTRSSLILTNGENMTRSARIGRNREDLVGFVNFLEPEFSLFVTGVDIGVIFARKLTKGLFDFVRTGSTRDIEYFVIIFVFHCLVQPFVFICHQGIRTLLEFFLFVAHADFDAGRTERLITECVTFEHFLDNGSLGFVAILYSLYRFMDVGIERFTNGRYGRQSFAA